MANDIAEVVQRIPTVTRVYVAFTLLFFVIGMTEIMPIFYFYNYLPFTFGKFQLWRLITAYFIPTPNLLSGMLEIYTLYKYSSQLEEGKFSTSTADYVWFSMIIGSIVLIGNILVGGVIYLPSLMMALTYTWAQENIGKDVSFYFLNVKAQFVPMLMLAVSFLLGGVQGVLQEGVGYAAAHLYLFLDSIWPMAGGKRYIKTPNLIRYYFPGKPNSASGGGGGSAGWTMFRPREQEPASSPSGFTSGFSRSSNFKGKGNRLGSS